MSASRRRGPTAWLAARRWLRYALAVTHRVIGAPDYERYVAHMRQHHPDCAIQDRDTFVREALQRRYNQPGSRCC